jgi:hypothetical protein
MPGEVGSPSFGRSRDLGELISKLQDVLEGTSDTGIVPMIREYRRSDRKDLQRLVEEYVDHRKRKDPEFSGENLSRELLEKRLPPMRVRCRDRETVTDGTWRTVSGWWPGFSKLMCCQLRTWRRIDAGADYPCGAGRWFGWRWKWERENLDKFERTGFVPLADGYFRWFAFKRETKPRIPVKRLATQDGLMGYPFRSAGQLSEPGPKGDEFDREDWHTLIRHLIIKWETVYWI